MNSRTCVIDADSHKNENPVVFRDYLPREFRERLGFVRDRYGEQRIRIVDVDPATGRPDLERLMLQPEGLGKGTFRPYHAESTIGGLFNRVRFEHMDREGIDHQLIYGSINLGFNSVIDPELNVALCRAYNDYVHDDCASHADRLHPVGILPLRDPEEAVAELRRCVHELGMVAVTTAPHLPVPHPEAPDRFPALRVPKHLSHPDFEPLLAEIERLDVGLALHGAPGVQLASGTADLLDSFTLVHVFANRGLQQMALARLIFDGTLERFPKLRIAFLEAGCGWLPDFLHSLHEHWEKRVEHFDPGIEPSPREFLLELVRERRSGGAGYLSRARRLMELLFTPSADAAPPDELERFRFEHPRAVRDPVEYLEQGRIFLSAEPGDPSPALLETALGDAGRGAPMLAVDYGHWDAEVAGCVGRTLQEPRFSPSLVDGLLADNALAFYGERLRRRIEPLEHVVGVAS